MKNITNNECIYNFNGSDIKVTKTISLFNAIVIVDTVKEMSFGEDGEYQPEYTDYVLRVETIGKYTNYELPDSLDERYNFVYSSGLYEEVIKLINEAQYTDIESAIKRKIAYQLRTNENKHNKDMEKLMNNFEELETTLGDILSGVKSEHVTALLNAIVDGSIDEEKLVKAYASEVLGKNE